MGRDAYIRDNFETASPGRLVVMLYDAAVHDLVTAERAMGISDFSTANDRLVHAQAVLLELLTSLDVNAWSGARGLADLYIFLVRELIAANVERDAGRVRTCLAMVQPLADAWREAVRSTGKSLRVIVESVA
jgi:flagellar protein FliS